MLYNYSNLVYFTMYSIIKLYKNYLEKLKILAYNQFIKTIRKLKIEFEYNFTIN